MSEMNSSQTIDAHEGDEYDVLEFSQILQIQESKRLFESRIDDDYMKRFNAFFDSLNSNFFTPHDFIFLGSLHSSINKCKGLNQLPPDSLWSNISKLVPALDAIREKLGEQFVLSSIYRGAEYNKCVGGKVSSQHLTFAAADCVPKNGSVVALHKVAKEVRNEGVFRGGIGLYNSFVHIDVRGRNIDWSKLTT